MAFGVSKAMVAPLAVLNFILYLISAAIAGSLLNKSIDNDGAFGKQSLTASFACLETLS